MSILPLYPPPANRSPPSLPTLPSRPSSLAQPFTNPEWTVSTHIFPAAFPRTRVGSTRQRGGPAVTRPEARMMKEELDRAHVELFERQRKASQVTAGTAQAAMEEQEQLWLCVNRYARSGARAGGAGFTMVCCHATGLHKETWEPALSSLVDNLPPGVAVDEIWSLDSLHQGDSALLNDGNIGSTSECPALPFGTPPHILTYHTAPKDLPERRIVGLGHSLGAAGIAVAASTLPSLFTALILVDGVMFPPSAVHADNHAPILAISKGAMSRKDQWPGRAEAEREMKAKKLFYGLWDERVLRRFVEFALVDSESGVRLKTRKEDEALVFADPERRGSFAAFSRLPYFSPDVKVHWVFAGNNPMVAVWAQQELFDATGHCRTTHTAIEGAGHLVTQEKPEELGKELARFLGQLGRREKL